MTQEQPVLKSDLQTSKIAITPTIESSGVLPSPSYEQSSAESPSDSTTHAKNRKCSIFNAATTGSSAFNNRPFLYTPTIHSPNVSGMYRDSFPHLQELLLDRTSEFASWISSRAEASTNVIKRLLIANNGIAAVKCIRCVRDWTYNQFGDSRIIHFICLATPEDIKANAEYIRMADELIEVAGGTNRNNYANVQLITDIALQTRADGVWPGWGHASEYPALPTSLREAGITWCGPSPEAMLALGDKIMSTLIAQTAGVPCLPWSGSGIKLDRNDALNANSDAFLRSCIHNVDEALSKAKDIGYPLMVKASEGGGGKGIRKVEKAGDMAAAYRQAVSEVPGSPVFLMRLLPDSRHLEVQLLADAHGQCIALFGRDCSVQRRHQKIIEEGPVTAASDSSKREMERRAVEMAEAVGYIGAGTVEYLYCEETKKFFFLELNPRLQVEHPVTEIISGVNLPAAQVLIAMGVPLYRIPDIRRLYNEDVDGFSFIDFKTQKPRKPDTHVIACRITAENSEFVPTSGEIKELNFRSTPNVWGYFSLKTLSTVHTFADSQFGHIFAVGENREEARKHLVVTLSELDIRGEIEITINYLRFILETEDYKANMITTTWLEQQIPIFKECGPKLPSHLCPTKIAVLGSTAQAYEKLQAAKEKHLSNLKNGRVETSKKFYESLFSITVELILKGTKYNLEVMQIGPGEFQLFCKTQPQWAVEVHVQGLLDSGLLMSMDCHTHVVYTQKRLGLYTISIDGHSFDFEKEHDPSQILSKFEGKMVTFVVVEGSHVTKNQVIGEIESMKLNMSIRAPEDGHIRFHVSPGSLLTPGTRIASLQLDNWESVNKSTPFKGSFPKWSLPHLRSKKAHKVLRHATTRIQNILKGYMATEQDVAGVVSELMDSFRDPRLPAHELSDVMSAIKGLVSDNLYQEITSTISDFLSQLQEGHRFPWEKPLEFPAQRIQTIVNLEVVKQKTPELERIIEVVDKYSNGVHIQIVQILIKLLTSFYESEKPFVGESFINVIHILRRDLPSNVQKVAELATTHKFCKIRSNLVMKLLSVVKSIFDQSLTKFSVLFIPILEKLSILNIPMMSDIHLYARQVLLTQKGSSQSEKLMQMKNFLLQYHPKRSSSSYDLVESGKNSPAGSTTPRLINPPTEENRALMRTGSMSNVLYANPRSSTAMLPSMPQYRDLGSQHDFLEDDSQGQFLIRQELSMVLGTLPRLMLDANVSRNALDLFIRNVFWDYDIAPRGFKIEEGTLAQMKFQIAPSAITRYEDTEDWTKNAMFVFCKDLFQLKERFGDILSGMELFVGDNKECTNESLIAGLGWNGTMLDDEAFIEQLESFIRPHIPRFTSMELEYVSILVNYKTEQPALFTFRRKHKYREDPITRHILPSLVPMLEIHRLKNFHINLRPTANRNIHVFEARPKVPLKGRYDGRRFFVRCQVTQRTSATQLVNDLFNTQVRVGGPEIALMESINSLETAMSEMSSSERAKWQFNHIFLSCLFEIDRTVLKKMVPGLWTDKSEQLMQMAADKMIALARGKFDAVMVVFKNLLEDLNVTRIEVRIQGSWNTANNKIIGCRIICDVPHPDCYELSEFWEILTPTGVVFEPVKDEYQLDRVSTLDPLALSSPHSVEEPLMQHRVCAKLLGTTYVYDWVGLIKQAIRDNWCDQRPKGVLVKATELILDVTQPGGLREKVRPAGQNDVAMVAWRVRLKTVNFPEGRTIILVANDITTKVGTFGPEEGDLYCRALRLAEAEGIPFLYMAANSGARMALDLESMSKFKVAWKGDPVTEPQCGFDYLYLLEADYAKLSAKVSCEKLIDPTSNEIRYKINSVIGVDGQDLGMSNLKWSGLIAGETARAAKKIVTISYVTARTVGIGAYLVRLGQRIIQCAGSPILLTGFRALNTLLGKEVYGSNLELGGLGIMINNGVTHLSVNSDFEGVKKSLEWLSFVPAQRNALFPVPHPLKDPVERAVLARPHSKTGYNPRLLIAGCSDSKHENSYSDNEDEVPSWLPGFFDKDSFVETLSNWAKTVVTGRARLGGIPVGVIAVETRQQESVYPSDPANQNSREEILSQAGQVWYPDSAFKTAQAIWDMRVEDLPLMIFANWRGFSGGQRDMFHQILKFGSWIVDALREYDQPVFVYLPPLAELRGGAWVVMDTNINPNFIEMYASESSRGGVLEPSGAAGLKFRGSKLKAAAERLDPILRKLSDSKDKSERRLSRERLMLPIYKTVATHFADLHDTPDGMERKKGIRKVIPWVNSREFFYWRLRRLLLRQQLARPLKNFEIELNMGSSLDFVRDLIRKYMSTKSEPRPEDRDVVHWLDDTDNRSAIETEIDQKIKRATKLRIANLAKTMGEEDIADIKKMLDDGISG